MVFEMSHEKHQYNGTLQAGDVISIHINGNPTPVEFTVNEGYLGSVSFQYVEHLV